MGSRDGAAEKVPPQHKIAPGCLLRWGRVYMARITPVGKLRNVIVQDKELVSETLEMLANSVINSLPQNAEGSGVLRRAVEENTGASLSYASALYSGSA